MLLNQLIDPLLIKTIKGPTNLFISNLDADSRNIQENGLFVCLKGATVNGHDFIGTAIENGAVAVLCEEPVSPVAGVTFIYVSDTRRALAIIASHFYHFPSHQMNMIGITGTNGKTTTSNLLEHIFSDYSLSTGLIGTINIRYGDKIVPSKNTTPEIHELQKIFHEMVQSSVSHVVMEVSSHALLLGRTRGTKFKTAVFTNLTQDHLDFHPTMTDYQAAKSLLFSQLGNTYDAPAYSVLNIDDAASKDYAEKTASQVITYGIDQDADVRATNISISPAGTSFTVETFQGSAHLHTKLIGKFNVYNMLAATATALIEGIPLDAIKTSLEAIGGVSGRFETVDAGQPFTVIVDYAHTPDSLENVLKTIREFKKGKVWTIIGCGGDRDKTKRPLMADVALRYSDMSVFTSDNPRTENPEDILCDMTQHLSSEGYVVISDREKAITYTLQSAAEHDIVLIAGKGHETYQIIGKDTLHFDDREIAKTVLQK